MGKAFRNTTSVVAAVLLSLYLVPTAAFAADNDAAQDAAPAAQATATVATVTAPDGKTTSYDTLATAVAAAVEGSTITLQSDLDLPAGAAGTAPAALDLKAGVTLDGAGHTLTVHGRGVYLYGGDDEAHSAAFVLKNITVTNPDAYGRTLSTRDGYKSLRLEDAVLTTTGAGNTQVLTIGGNTPQTTTIDIVASTLTASQAGYGIITFNPVDLTIADSQISGYAALYMKGPDASAGSSDSKVTISDGSVLTGKGIAGPTNSFGTIVLQQCDDVTVDVTDATINAEGAPDDSADAATQSAVLFSTYGLEDDTAAKSNAVTIGEGTTVNATGEHSALASVIGRDNQVKAEDGTYHLEGAVVEAATTAAKPAESLVVTGGNWNKDVAEYAPEGYAETRTGGDGDAPFTIDKATPEKPDTPTEPTDPDTPTTPDEPTNPDTPGAGDDADNHATEGDNAEGTANDDAADSTDKDAAGATEGTTHSGGSNATSGTTTPHRTTTGTSTAKRYASIPQTSDDNPLLPFALGAATTSLIVLAALLVYRKRASHLR